MLYQRARHILEDSANLERAAGKASAGWEAEIAIAVEVLFPSWLLFECLEQFGQESALTRINVYETVIDGGPELLRQGKVDLAVLPSIPQGFHGENLPSTVRMIPVAHPQHPLHQLSNLITLRDLRKYRHLVVRDTASQRTLLTGTVEVEQRWTLTNMSSSIAAASKGYGFAWLPEEKIRTELNTGLLKELPLAGGRERVLPMYLIYADIEAAGPGTKRLAEIIREQVRKHKS
jgi:DNA-binding transcriptional LysR family regulator